MKHTYLVILILAVAFLRLYPAVTNEFPKGSDSWFHMRSAEKMLETGSLINYDELNAGGHINSYPPGFHVFLAGLFSFLDPMESAKYIGILLSVAAVVVFYFFMRSYKKDIALLATFVFGVSVEIINTSLFLAPTNIGLLLIPAVLYCLEGGRKKFNYLAVLLSSLLAITHPMSLIILLLFVLVFFYEKIRKICPIFVVPVLVLAAMQAYFFLLGAENTVVLSQPDAFLFVSAFQLPFIVLLAFGLRKDRLSLLFAFMFLWTAFSPLYPERALTFAIIPASILAAKGFAILKNCRKTVMMKTGLIVLLMLSMVPVLDYGYARTEMTKNDYEMLLWAEENTNGTIASTWQVSAPWIEYIAGKGTILGPFQEAVPDYKERRADLEKLFTGSEGEARIILNKYDSGYVFVNKLEDFLLYPGSINRFKTYFEEVQSNGYAYVFKA